MKYFTCYFLFVLAVSLSSCCSNKQDRVIKDFGQHYLQAQHDYCSTNIFVAEQGVENFREWLLDTNHPTEPVMNRDAALYHINGRLFLIEEYVGNAKDSEKFYQESMKDWNDYLQHLQSLHLPTEPHPLKPISSKEELREQLARQDKGLNVGWMKN